MYKNTLLKDNVETRVQANSNMLLEKYDGEPLPGMVHCIDSKHPHVHPFMIYCKKYEYSFMPVFKGSLSLMSI